MSSLNERYFKMIKEKYKQLCLSCHIGGIYTIAFTQPLWARLKNDTTHNDNFKSIIKWTSK